MTAIPAGCLLSRLLREDDTVHPCTEIEKF